VDEFVYMNCKMEDLGSLMFGSPRMNEFQQEGYFFSRFNFLPCLLLFFYSKKHFFFS
jgi:hypothetical protein